MTLNDLERENRGFNGFFWRFRAATQNHSQGGATVLALVAWRSW